MHLTSEQIRAARALIRMEQRALAEISSVSLVTLKRLERQPGPLRAQASTVAKLQGALEGRGVAFLNDGEPGVRMRRQPDQP